MSFAKKCGLSDGLIRKYIKGSLPGVDKLVTIAKVGGVSISWLATGEGPMRRAKEGAAPGIPGMPYSREQAEADMPADLLHGDLDARARRDEQQKAGFDRLRDTSAMVNQACEDVGYSPPKVTRAAINGLAMLYDIDYDHIVMLTVSLKHDQGK